MSKAVCFRSHAFLQTWSSPSDVEDAMLGTGDSLAYPVSITSRLGKGKEHGAERRNGSIYNSKPFYVHWNSTKEII